MASLIHYIVNYNGYPLQAYLLENIDVVGYMAAIYLVMVGKGEHILSWWNNRKVPATDTHAKQNGASKDTMAALKSCYTSAFIYHFAICVTCAIVSCMLVPAMAQSLLVNSFFATMCLWDDARTYKGYVGFALSASVVVKVVEQLDTFFLVLRDYIVASPAQSKKQVRRVLPSHWWFQVLIALYFWHTYSIGSSSFTMMATVTMVISAARNFFYMQQDALQAQGKTAIAAKWNHKILVLDMVEWIGCSALSVYASYMNYTHERGCMTMQANVRMALVMYVTAFALRFREMGKEAATQVVHELKKQ
ncbi:hypothetical protein, unknown function [Leishmania tarentolae]|uniref:Elongation of fatty acids protein n=1 Tax=Leishmania tarentolae TaxID=5689 RepID=A0A640KHX3_LEITA|nr:hypothetical protein, unknown function [Leishmania tarentolae]